MPKKTTAAKLSEIIIEALDPISDAPETTDGHPGNSLTHGHSNEFHNYSVKLFMERNLMKQLMCDNVGKDGKVYLGGYNWLVQAHAKAKADAAATISAFHNPGDDDTRPTRSKLISTARKADRMEQQVGVAELFMEAFQAAYIHYMGTPFEPTEAQPETATDEELDALMKKYAS
tara:strand:+ start:559 stop:1080 length:522 start_codon:yes stop_codon:yes gene_type:complete